MDGILKQTFNIHLIIPNQFKPFNERNVSIMITDPHVTTQIGDHVKDNALFPVSEDNNDADDVNHDNAK